VGSMRGFRPGTALSASDFGDGWSSPEEKTTRQRSQNEGRKRLLPLAEIAFCIDGFRQS
jgi:hypothetical protein